LPGGAGASIAQAWVVGSGSRIVGALVGGLIAGLIGAGWVITIILEVAAAALLVYLLTGRSRAST
jgi:hypothetical protein